MTRLSKPVVRDVRHKRSLALRFRTIGVWLGPRGQSYDLIRIFTLNAIVGFFFLYFGALGIENGAAHYQMWAESLISGESIRGVNGMYIRDVGMALITLLGGYTLTHSLIGVVIIQFLMGMAMPPLAYLALRPWFPKTAYYAAIASILTLGPFILAKTIHHDQPYIFFTILNLYLINFYVWKKHPTTFYGMTLAVFAMSLIRQVGKGLYPLLVLVALLESRKNLKHIAAAVLIFIACNFGYTKYREHVLGNLPALGQEAFENIYLNSSEYGVRLSPDVGPNMKFIADRAYQCALPSPARSEQLKDGPSAPDFMAEHFYKYSATELVDQVFTHTNREYLYYLLGCISDDVVVLDRVMLGASLETVVSHPGFILAYSLRNIFQLLYDPGWLHGRQTMEPHLRGGLLFQFLGATTAGRGNIGDNLPEPALSEARFLPLPRQPQFIQAIYFWIEAKWEQRYHTVTIVVGLFGLFTWISTVIGLLHRFFGTRVLKRWSKLWLSERVLPATLGASALLLGNVLVTAIFIDSYYRYDYSLAILKIVLAAVGCNVMVNLLRPFAMRAAPALSGTIHAIPSSAAIRPARPGSFRLPTVKVRVATVLRIGAVVLLLGALSAGGYKAAHYLLDKQTRVSQLPPLPDNARWDLIWGLQAKATNEAPVAVGQRVLELTAVPSDDRHALAARFGGLAAGELYRITVWVRSPFAQIQIRDSVVPATGNPAHYGEARFNISARSVTMAKGDIAVDGVFPGANGWNKIQANLRTADGEIFIYLGLLNEDGTSHVFNGRGEKLIFGGFELSPIRPKM